MIRTRSTIHTGAAIALLVATGVAAGLTMWFLTLWMMWIFLVLMVVTSVVITTTK